MGRGSESCEKHISHSLCNSPVLSPAQGRLPCLPAAACWMCNCTELLLQEEASVFNKMPEDGRTWQLVDLLGKKKTLPPSVSRGVILILAFLCKDTLSQPPQKYSINVPHHVDVQRGLSARISCQFTYAPHDLYWGNEIYGYWFKFHETERHCLKPDSSCHQGHLMATNDYRQSVETSARDRFYLTGDPKQRSCSFLIVNAQLEDAGLYYFRVQAGWKLKYSYSISPQKNLGTSRSQWPYRNISSKKKEGDLEPVTVQEGDSVHLLCQASGNPDPVLTWRNQNKTFTESLPLAQVGLEAAGEYECQAVNSLGSAKITIQLLVQYSPRTMTFRVSRASRKNQTLTRDAPQEVAEGSQWMAEEGSSLWLLCKADSSPPAKAHWIKEGRTLESFPHSWLALTNLTVTDEGKYTCQAENFLGLISGTFHLYVAHAPKVSQNSLRNTTCWYRDKGFVCDCSLSSKPGPEIQWQVDGELISGSSNDSNWQVTSLVQEEEATSSLNWTGSLETDHRITCTGRNAFGVCTVQFLLSSLKNCTITASSTGGKLRQLLDCNAHLPRVKKFTQVNLRPDPKHF
ncbi:Sialic acid-binding Ig-like lectin 5 [Varanus komodoensis]|nr:Sialic acid-binding Ig-like lectin 5 [Varanus komodoensis]